MIDNDELNYECEVLDPVPTDPDWKHFQFHGDNHLLAIDHIRHVMPHQGIRQTRIRKLGNVRWQTLTLK